MAESTETLDLKEFQLHAKDTGSADVQVAQLERHLSAEVEQKVFERLARSPVELDDGVHAFSAL